MNIITNLKTNFKAPTTCPSQIMQFHHVASPLKNLFDNNAISKNISYRNFTNPNFFNQNTHGERHPSNYKKINHFEVRQNEEVENPQNSCEMIAKNSLTENSDFSSEIALGLPKQTIDSGASSRKRARNSRHSNKTPDKHNFNTHILKEMMDIDFENDSATDISFQIGTDDKDQENDLGCFNLGDLFVVGEHSSPVSLSRIDIAIDSSIPIQRTCLTFPACSPKCRNRQISITESEDSFIVFETEADEECDYSEDAVSDDESSELEENEESDEDSPESIIPTKKVRFANDKELCQIHPMVKWSFAYKAARKGPWEMYARDRERFKNRISLVERKISQCFQPDHRQKVYNRLFEEKFVK